MPGPSRETKKSMQDMGFTPEGVNRGMEILQAIQPWLDKYLGDTLARGISPWETADLLRDVLGAYCLRDNVITKWNTR